MRSPTRNLFYTIEEMLDNKKQQKQKQDKQTQQAPKPINKNMSKEERKALYVSIWLDIFHVNFFGKNRAIRSLPREVEVMQVEPLVLHQDDLA